MKRAINKMWSLLLVALAFIVSLPKAYYNNAISSGIFGTPTKRTTQAMAVVDTLYEINETDDNFTLGSDVSAGGGDGSTAYKYGSYTVPDGVDLVFLPNSIFMFYGKDNESTPAEFGDYVPIQIIHKDNTSQGQFPRLKTRYVQAKFSADIDQQKKFDQKFRVKPNEILEIQVIVPSGSSMDVSECKFTMTARRIAKQLTP